MPNYVKEPYQVHYIIDNTYRGETINEDTVIAGVVSSSTGPCDEMVISSVAELCDLYLNSDTITADADPTLIHAAKILQFSPIHVVRAANDNVKAGVTNHGGTIFTDKNYTPFKYSKTFEIEGNVNSNNYGFLGFTDVNEANGAKLNTGKIFAWGYQSSDKTIHLPEGLDDAIKKKWTKKDGITNLTLLGAEGTFKEGIDPIFEQIKETNNAGITKDVGFDFSNSEYHVVYNTKNVVCDVYPGVFTDGSTSIDKKWLTVKQTDISNDVYHLHVVPTEDYVVEGVDYIHLNGYSFYLGVQEESANINVPGTAVEININREEGAKITPNVFALYVFDEIVKSEKFASPVVSNVDASVEFKIVKGAYLNIVTDLGKYFDVFIEDDKSAYTAKDDEVNYYTNISVSAGTVVKIVPKVNANTIISGEHFMFINVSNREDAYNPVTETIVKSKDEGKSVEVSANEISFTFEDNKNVVNPDAAIKVEIVDGSSDKEIVYLSGSTNQSSGGVFASFTGSKSNGVSGKISNSTGKWVVTLNNYSDSEKVGESQFVRVTFYKNEFVDDTDSETYAVYFGQTSNRPYKKATALVGDVSVPLAAFKIGIALQSIVKGLNDKFIDKKDDSTDIYNVGSIDLYGLKANWRALSSSTSMFKVGNAEKGFIRTLITKDVYNFTQNKDYYVLKLGNIVFWNGKYYTPSSAQEDTYNLSKASMTFNDFMAAVLDELPSFSGVMPSIADTNKITLFGTAPIETVVKFGKLGEEYEVVEAIDSKDYEFDLASRFAVIASFPSNTKLFSVKMTARDDDTWDLTLKRKTTSATFNVSFVPGAVNGYGTGIYFDYVNEDAIDYKVIELNQDAEAVEIPEEITFGDEIVVGTPGLTQRKNALSKLTLDTGYYYNYITELGYTNVSYDVYATQIAETLNAQYIFTAPKDYLDSTSIIRYRDATALDSRNASMFVPFYKDSTVGNFITDMSPSVAFLERNLANKALFKEFCPSFGPVNGETSITTKRSSSSGLLVDFNTKEEREKLLTAQVNPIRIDRGLGITYFDDTWTTQKKDSYLSDFNNMYMTNIIQHVLDTFMKEYFASANVKATRDNVVTVLTAAFNDRLFANQSYTPFSIEVICDESNNPLSVINDRTLVVDVKVIYNVAIKYIKTYTRVISITES